jgi:D-proline reductase (dithiol) PrdB
MARIADLPLKYRLFMQAYPYRWIDWRPGTHLSKPLSTARLAMITTAGYFLPDQQPFDQSIRHDDCSFREIPWGTPIGDLRIGQSSDAFDHSGIEADRNLAFPLDRLRELVAEGKVGEAAPRHFSLMGSIAAPKRLMSESGPEIASKLAEDGADAVFLAPVCPMCHHTAGIVQSIIEKSGIPTVSISLLMEVTKRVEPPRVLAIDRPLGYPLGEPNNADLQRQILLAAIELLHRPVTEPLTVPFP